MAAITIYTHFRDDPRPDGLCPKCFNPSLRTYTLQRIDMDGITPIGNRVACRDCNKWITKLEIFA